VFDALMYSLTLICSTYGTNVISAFMYYTGSFTVSCTTFSSTAVKCFNVTNELRFVVINVRQHNSVQLHSCLKA